MIFLPLTRSVVRENAKHHQHCHQKHRSLARQTKVLVTICSLNVMNLRQANLTIAIFLSANEATNQSCQNCSGTNVKLHDRSLKCCPGWTGVKCHELLHQTSVECSHGVAKSSDLLRGFVIASACMTMKSMDVIKFSLEEERHVLWSKARARDLGPGGDGCNCLRLFANPVDCCLTRHLNFATQLLTSPKSTHHCA